MDNKYGFFTRKQAYKTLYLLISQIKEEKKPANPHARIDDMRVSRF
jgi:hypothetical protein